MTTHEIYTIEKGIIVVNAIDNNIRNLTWHRLGGPAIISYRENGIIYNESYYINDVYYTKENYYNELLKLKVQSL